MSKCRWMLGLIGGLALGALASGPAAASAITIGFSGKLTEVPVELQSVFSVGDAFSGSYTYQSDAPDVGTPEVGLYEWSSFEITIGGLSIAEGPGLANQIWIVNNTLSAVPGDIYRVDAISTDSTPTTVNGYTPDKLELQMSDLTGNAIPGTDKSLPLFAPTFEDFAFRQTLAIFFRLDDPFTRVLMWGQLDDPLTTVSTVPEPATLALLGAGLAGLWAAGRRKRVA